MMNNEKNDMEMIQKMDLCRKLVDEYLRGYFVEAGLSYATLVESMRYSLLAGGKRIRAILCMQFCVATGGNPELALPAACAVEMLHTYSLIHDDLPSMDGSDMRRGMPSNHFAYGEFTAILAGDALQASAFEALARSELPAEDVVKMVKVLARAAGAYGICGGQYLDLSGEGWHLTIEEILELYSMKTAALISAATQLGVIAGGGSKEQIEAADAYAQAIGLAFQIRDDVLDCTATADELGKPTSADEGNEKSTFASLLGVEACEKMISRETEKATKALEGHFEDTEILTWLARVLADRKN